MHGDGLDSRDRQGLAPCVLFELPALGALGDGEGEVHVGVGSLDAHAVDHAEVDDVGTQFGVDDALEGGVDVVDDGHGTRVWPARGYRWGFPYRARRNRRYTAVSMEQALFIKSKAPGSTVALTDLAVEKVRELVVAEGDPDLALRMAVRPGGCSGFSYEMYFDTQVEDDDIVELANGCICCTVRGDLIRILGNLLKRRDKFDHILVETTGLADPGPVVQTFFVDEDIREKTFVNGVVTVVDAHHIARHIEDTHEAEEQIAFADVILLNKCDLVPADTLDGLERRLREVNALATIHRTTKAEIDIAKVLEVGGFNLDRSALKSPIFPFAATTGGAKALVGNLQFDPELVDSYEIGAKYSTGPFSLSLSAFRSDFSNFQLNTFNGTVFLVQTINGCNGDLVGGPDSDRDTSSATGACAQEDVGYGVRTQGFELEAQLVPAPDFRVAAGLTYARTKYRDDLVGNKSGAPLDQALRYLPGDNLSNAPELVATGSITWTPELGSSGLSGLVYIDGRMTSDYNTGSDLFPQKEQDGYALFNARVGVRGPDEKWSIELWAQNIFDKDYAQVAFNTPFQAGGSGAPFNDAGNYPGGRQIFSQFLAEPRTYGITLRGKY